MSTRILDQRGHALVEKTGIDQKVCLQICSTLSCQALRCLQSLIERKSSSRTDESCRCKTIDQQPSIIHHGHQHHHNIIRHRRQNQQQCRIGPYRQRLFPLSLLGRIAIGNQTGALVNGIGSQDLKDGQEDQSISIMQATTMIHLLHRKHLAATNANPEASRQ